MPPGYAPRMRELLVLRALGLGDLLVAVPALRALRRRYPTHRLALAAPAALDPLARATGRRRRDPADHRAGRARLGRPAAPRRGREPPRRRAAEPPRPRRDASGPAHRRARPGWAGPDWADIARAHRHERERWCAVVEAFGVCADPTDLALDGRVPGGGGDAVVVHPGAGYGAKRWPADRFAVVANRLEHAGHRVVVDRVGRRSGARRRTWRSGPGCPPIGCWRAAPTSRASWTSWPARPSWCAATRASRPRDRARRAVGRVFGRNRRTGGARRRAGRTSSSPPLTAAAATRSPTTPTRRCWASAWTR